MIQIRPELVIETNYKILIKLTSRSRPAKLIKCIENIHEMSNENVYIFLTLDSDDTLCNNEFVIGYLNDYINSDKNKKTPLYYNFDKSKNKIDAINRDLSIIPLKDWNILVNYSDDNIIIKKGFDTIIRQKMAENFRDTDGCLWFDDGFTHDLLCTLCIIGRKYFERFNYIYHPSYISLFCDNEFTEVAQKIDKIKYTNQVLIRHNHPIFSGEKYDEQYIKTESYYDTDKQNYNKRKANGFKNI